ncbi:septum formation inhibitor Maf [Tamlana fucoidanivorans]|nr:septum formation inhibitor Maf [Tamlana fucoidanivorans]
MLSKIILSCICFIVSCKNNTETSSLVKNTAAHAQKKTITPTLSKSFKAYWYTGEAEISSYQLEQARYGELRTGKAVLIYVTEDFLPDALVKAEHPNPNNIPVLKLNATKTFNTGIYPYSIMQSTFYPVANNGHALKVSSSVQEWCGHAYTQLNNHDAFEIMSHSYFQGEADKTFTLKKAVLENELWVQLRVNPSTLPVGNINIIPAFAYTRLKHIPIKAFKANASLKTGTYTITYPELQRTLSINFNPEFPYDILGWKETFNSGFGTTSKVLTTKATKLKSIKSPYWKKNRNQDKILRETLMLNE